MVVYDFHILRARVCPDEADAVLVIDADTVLSFPLPFKRFQAVPGDGAKVVQRFSGVQNFEAFSRRALDGLALLRNLFRNSFTLKRERSLRALLAFRQQPAPATRRSNEQLLISIVLFRPRNRT